MKCMISSTILVMFRPDEEDADACAAKKIIESLGLNHKIYKIPLNNDKLSDFGDVAKILFWNTLHYVKTMRMT